MGSDCISSLSLLIFFLSICFNLIQNLYKGKCFICLLFLLMHLQELASTLFLLFLLMPGEGCDLSLWHSLEIFSYLSCCTYNTFGLIGDVLLLFSLVYYVSLFIHR